MTPRSIRRAAERKAKKLARKGASNQANPFTTPLINPVALTDESETLQMPAREQNSATPKTIAALDPVEALTGGAILLPSADADLYQKLLNEYERQYRPIGGEKRPGSVAR